MKLRFVPVAFLACALASCANKPGISGSRESGQSRLMGQTFAGKNKCSPENHLRPFIIEWDATDMSSFESFTSTDIVFVKYEGCTLTVLDECRNDSIRGEQGAYNPPDWTSGSLEVVDIANEGELYAKLPLGAVSLGGRVSGGEKFHMEYYVAGTRLATRASVYRDDLKANAGCEGATHFVYAYNLGAFALGSAQNLETEVGASAYGFNVGGSTKNTRAAEKKGGDLGVCKSDSATEVAGCKAPIRLTLREIKAGENPSVTAQKAPESLSSMTAAMELADKMDMGAAARGHFDAAIAKHDAGDGKGCLKEFDQHDRAAPKRPSTDPKLRISTYRATCLMLAGKCKAGRELGRKAWGHINEKSQGPEAVDKMIDTLAAKFCPSSTLPAQDQLAQAMAALAHGAHIKKETAATCVKNAKVIEKLRDKVKLKDGKDTAKLTAMSLSGDAAFCLAKAGDCKKAWAYHKKWQPVFLPHLAKQKPDQLEKSLRASFEGIHKTCKGKAF